MSSEHNERREVTVTVLAALCALFLLTACTNHASHTATAPAPAVAPPQQADSAPAAALKGYRAPPLIPKGYAPPPLLTLTPERQLEVYKRMEDHYIGQTVKRGDHVFPLPTAAEPIAPKIAWRGKKYDDLTKFMSDARITGVLVLRDGAIALERYALGHSANDRWTSFSVAKSVTSLLLGAAIQDGAVRSLDDPVTRYIPELQGSGYEGVTIRQLMTMTSGVRWNEDYGDPRSDVARSGLEPGEPGMNALLSYMRRLPRAAEPGKVFLYKTGETDLVGILIANAVGRGIGQYLSEKIWAPFGMEQDAFWVVDRNSMERGGCCLSMTLRDYGRVALFVLGGGVAGGKQVVPTSYLKEATSHQLASSMPGYGYFFWVHGPGGFSARGIFGQTIWWAPEERLALVTNGAWSTAMSSDGFAAVTALFEAVRAASSSR
jgi:CubicO group peptidase (beta-lactamase class C family)